MDNLADIWNQFKADQPELALALQLTPGTGHLAAAVDYYDAMRKGDTPGAMLAATSFLPGGALIKSGKQGLSLAQLYRTMAKSPNFTARGTELARSLTTNGASEVALGVAGKAAGIGLDAANYINAKITPQTP